MSSTIKSKPDLTKIVPTPRDIIEAAPKYVADTQQALPTSYLVWPSQLSYWDNNVDGDCVTAEEAFAKILVAPYAFLSDGEVISWADQYNFENGANLYDVMTTMQTQGIHFNGGMLYDGSPSTVVWTDPQQLQSAIYNSGPVKMGVAAENFQSNQHPVTPGKDGWALYGYPSGLAEDHCIGLCGYGSLSDLIGLFKSQGVNISQSSGMPGGTWYAAFTWNSVGIIDEQSLINMTGEAWVRSPVTTMSGFPQVSEFQVKNDAGFVCDIHTLYRLPTSSGYTEVANKDNFPIDKTKTMNIGTKCDYGKTGGIANGDIVQLKIWVEAGSDNTYNGWFIYNNSGPTQSFKISGGTHDSAIEYLGPV